MTRTLYFKGAEIILMPFCYQHTEHRKHYIHKSIHGSSIVKASWTNGFYSLYCNSAETREPNEWNENTATYPGWAGIVSPWGKVICNIDKDGNEESMVIEKLKPETLIDRRRHPNFLVKELRTEIYKFKE